MGSDQRNIRECIVDSATEKRAIGQVVAMVERFSGELTDTRYDKGGNYPGSDIPGGMDCIDQYLSASVRVAGI